MTEPQAAAAEPRAKAANVLAYPGYVKLLAASLLGALGDRFYQGLMIATANAILIKRTATTQANRVQIFSILPMLILYGFVGSLVDACDRRKLLTYLEAIKVVLVLGFIWLLRNFNSPGQFTPSETVPPEFYFALGLVMVLNAITVPFSPARASVVPDVLPPENRSMGASLIATAGLCSYLIGSFAGIELSKVSNLGPIKMTIVTSVLFAISALIFRWLPQNVTIPNNQKKGSEAEEAVPPRKMSFVEYLREQYDGFRYCVRHPSLLGLILFETIFWTIASMVLVLLLFYANYKLGLEGDPKSSFFAIGLTVAGVGIVGGALGAGKLTRVLSPVFSYVPAFLFVAFGFLFAFGVEPTTKIINGIATPQTPITFLPMLFLMALGGGMMLGRVDADVLAIADERYRGRIFSLKAVAFGICTLAATYFLGERLTDAQTLALIHGLPRVLLWLSPLVFIFAWLVDTAIWSHHAEVSAPNFRRRIQFKLCRFISWCWLKLHFRFTVVGAERVPLNGPVILVANHGSFLDPLFMGVAAPRMTQFMMYRSYYESFMHPLFRWLSCIPVDEHKHLQALKTGVASLEKGACIGIFPEGQVAYEKKLYPPQGGAIFLAQRSGAPIVPMAFKGDWDVLPRGAKFPKFKKVIAVFGEPFTVPRNLSKHETAEVTRKMMSAIAEMLGVPPPEEPSEPVEKKPEA